MSLFETAAEITQPPFASDVSCWSGPHPEQIGPTYGLLYAVPGGIPGSWTLSHDIAQRYPVMALDRLAEPPEVVVHDGRRWRVRKVGA